MGFRKKNLAHAFIFSRLDHRNGVFTDLPDKSTRQLQLNQNAAYSSVLTNAEKVDQINPSSHIFTLDLCLSNNWCHNTACRFIKRWMVLGQNTFLILWYIMNHPDLSDRLGKVRVGSSRKLNEVKRHYVFMLRIFGTKLAENCKSVTTLGSLKWDLFWEMLHFIWVTWVLDSFVVLYWIFYSNFYLFYLSLF